MNSIKLITDFGHSQFTLGHAGNTKPYKIQNNNAEFPETEIIEFLKNDINSSYNVSPIILIEKNVRNPKFRDIFCQMLFENLGASKLFLGKNSVFRLYASGRSSGAVIENSETSFEIASIEDGFLDQSRIVVSPFSVGALACDNLYDFRKTFETSIKNNEYTLPDSLTINSTAYECSCVNLIDEFLNKNNLFSKEVVFGGRVLLHKGMMDPLLRTVKGKFEVNQNSVKSEFLCNGAFIGASILGVLAEIEQLFVTKAEWEEFGSMIIHKQFQ